MARAAVSPTSRNTVKPAKATVRTASPTGRLNEVLTVAKEHGLLSGTRTRVLRGRMPAGLVEQAKRRSGITSDSKLLEAALANLAVADDYWQWLHSQRGTINPDLDLEF